MIEYEVLECNKNASHDTNEAETVNRICFENTSHDTNETETVNRICLENTSHDINETETVNQICFENPSHDTNETETLNQICKNTSYDTNETETVNRICFDPNNITGELPDKYKEEAELDLHEKQEWINRDVEALRDMLEGEQDLHGRKDKPFLLAFLRARKFDYEKALIMIRGYYTSQKNNKELYTNLLPSFLSHIWPLNMQTVLSRPDKKGRTVLIFFTEAWDPEKVSLDDVFRAQVLLLEHVVRLPITQLKGVSAIVDCKGLSFNKVSYITPLHIKRMVSIIQEIFPLRFKALHFVNEPSIFDWTFSLVKPFLSETMKGRLHFHGENLSDLEEHFPLDILPSCFGGYGGPVDNSILVENLLKNEDYFKDNFSYGYIYDEVATEASEESTQQSSVLTTVAEVGFYLGSYYRRMCIE